MRFSSASATVSIACSTSESDTRTALWPNSSITNSAVSASMAWFNVTIMPIFMSDLTTSAPRSAIRLASSLTTMTSGSCTSRNCFSGLLPKPIALLRAFSCLRFMAARLRVRPPSPSMAEDSVSLPERRPSSPLALALRSRSSRSRSVLRGVGKPGLALAGPRSSIPGAGAGRALRAGAAASVLAAGAAGSGAAGLRRCVPKISALRCSARFAASSAASARARSSSSTLARRAASRARSSRSLASISSRRRMRSSSRARSSSARLAASSCSRALACRKAVRRRSISASEMPAGRLDGSPKFGAPPEAAPEPDPGLPGVGTTTRLRLVSTTTACVRPWEKLCFTEPERGAPPRPRGFLPSVSLMRPTYPSWRSSRRPAHPAAQFATRKALPLPLQHAS